MQRESEREREREREEFKVSRLSFRFSDTHSKDTAVVHASFFTSKLMCVQTHAKEKTHTFIHTVSFVSSPLSFSIPFIIVKEGTKTLFEEDMGRPYV